MDTKNDHRGLPGAQNKDRTSSPAPAAPAREHAVRPALSARDTEAIVARIASAEVLARIVGEDAAIVGLRETLRAAALGSDPILILGERGTGRSLCARVLHDLRARPDLPFVAVRGTALNAARLDRFASLREELLSSLAPHAGRHRASMPPLAKRTVVGAATAPSTAEAQAGLFLLVGGGTLVVEDLDALSSAAQAQVLRLLVRSAIRFGQGDSDASPLCAVATMHRDPGRRIKARRLDEGLAARFAARIHLPPLRERGRDIGLLATHFASRLRGRRDLEVGEISPEALRLLGEHPWPGNVRELYDVVVRALTDAGGGQILPAHVRFAIADGDCPRMQPDPDLESACEAGSSPRRRPPRPAGKPTTETRCESRALDRI